MEETFKTINDCKKRYLKLLREFEGKDAVLAILQTPDDAKNYKSDEWSVKERNQGNSVYMKSEHSSDDHKEIFECYTKSICAASNGSEELAFAYGNRSAFLVHIKKYEESLEDINRALKITTSNVFKMKLLARKVECLKAIGSPEYKSALKKANGLIKSISDKDPVKEHLLELISKAESTLENSNRNLVDKNKENICMKLSKKLKKVDPFKSVRIQYDKRNGRYLVANRDFEVGELIFAEKFYVTTINYDKRHIYCANCLAFCWTGIPCDFCHWAKFCSDQCKNEALDGSHKVECKIYPLLHVLNSELLTINQNAIRLVLQALDEAGSIENLRSQLKVIDDEGDQAWRDTFSGGEKFEPMFKTAYTLTSRFNPENQISAVIFGSVFLTRILLKDSIFSNIQDLLNNEDATFIGSLFLKMLGVQRANCIFLNNPAEHCNHPNATEGTHRIDFCRAKGAGIGLLTRYTSHSCSPNVFQVPSDKQHHIVYAFRPIKKDEQLFDCHQLCFYKFSKAYRTKTIREKYFFTCKCEACVNNWPTWDPTKHNIILFPSNVVEAVTSVILRQLEKSPDLFKDENLNNYEEHIKNLVICLSKAFKHLPLKLTPPWILADVLKNYYWKLYGPKKLKFDECKIPL